MSAAALREARAEADFWKGRALELSGAVDHVSAQVAALVEQVKALGGKLPPELGGAPDGVEVAEVVG